MAKKNGKGHQGTGTYALDTYAGLDEALGDNHFRIQQSSGAFTARSISCPSCRELRNADFELLRASRESDARTGMFLSVRCRECHVAGFVTIYQGATGMDVAYHWPVLGGLATPNTPPAVAYYLDQAARSEAGGARSAAIAMYRAALEHLLYEQRYTSGMLHAKITALNADIQNAKAPKWAMEIDPAFLTVLKDLGNGAIHTNGGDHTKQEAIDTDLLQDVHATIRELLEVVYEEPIRRANRLASLSRAADKLK